MRRDTGGPDNVPLAVVVIVVTVLALSLGDALIKRSGGAIALGQVFVLRSALALPILLGLLIAMRRPVAALLRPPGWAVLRSALLVAMWVAYYLSLPHLTLSMAAAAFYTAPLFITLLSGLVTGERIGATGWIAVGLGFVGVALILRPGTGDFQAATFLPLLAAMFYAAAMVLTRSRSRDADPLALAALLNAGFILVGGAGWLAGEVLGAAAGSTGLTAPWAPLAEGAWGLIAILAVCTAIGSVGGAMAYTLAPPSVVAPFDFAYVGFAVLWGLILFAELPDAVAVAGMGLIVLGGVLAVTPRGRRPVRPTVRPPG